MGSPISQRNGWKGASKLCTPAKQSNVQGRVPFTRRAIALLMPGSLALMRFSEGSLGSTPVSRLTVDPSLAPDKTKFDQNDGDLLEALRLLNGALEIPSIPDEEAAWRDIINRYEGLDRPWVPDVVGRAHSNLGNALQKQLRFDEAIEEYTKSAAICPWSVDPLLNRGVALEAQGRFQEAITDYEALLEAQPLDPAGWNNLGNAWAGLGDWDEAEYYYGKALQLNPSYSQAAANRRLAEYQLGLGKGAMKGMKELLRRYPNFDDVRAAYAAALWNEGEVSLAEEQWSRVQDSRYKDRYWVRTYRRWPPALADALEKLLDIQMVGKP